MVKEKKVNSEVIESPSNIELDIVESLYDTWLRWSNEKLSNIETILESNFPDKWEINKIGSPETYIKKIYYNGEEERKEFFERLKLGNYATQFIEIIIHFPEIRIKNANNRSHKIHDLFIKINLKTNFSNSHTYYFHGRRSSYTLAEYQSNYSHSHRSNSNGYNWSHFCLGSTNFSTLCRTLCYEFSEDNFDLFCTMLPDYLSWESRAGGAYSYFGDISERSTSVNRVRISSEIIEYFYNSFLKEKIELNPTLSVDNDIISFSFNNEKEYITQIVTSLIPSDAKKDYMVVFDSTTGETHPIIDSREMEIEKIEKLIKKTYSIRFKGKYIEGKIINNKIKEEDKKTVEKIFVASPIIINGIIIKLSEDINKALYEQYI